MGDTVNNIDVDERIYDPFMDLYIIFGRSVEERAKPYCVAWQMREEQKLTQPRSFKHALNARTHFNEAAIGEIEPKICNRDPLIQSVYNWEDNLLKNHLEHLNKKSARALIKQVAEDYAFDAPIIKFNTKGNYYYPEPNKIHLAHMNSLTLLHELSHALVEHQAQTMNRPYVYHSPQFVWNAIELYHKYAGIDLQYLVTTAAQFDILGDTKARRLWVLDRQP